MEPIFQMEATQPKPNLKKTGNTNVEQAQTIKYTDSYESDDELMLKCAAGSTNAFETLVRRYYGIVRASAILYLGEKALGNDVAQDTFLSIWNRRDQYIPCGRFKSYINKVTFNFCHMAIRTRKSEQNRKRILLQEQKLGTALPDLPSDKLMQAEMSHRAQKKLVHLPDKERKVLLLRYGQNMTMVETAEVLGIPLGTAKSHATRGLKRLYERMNSDVT